MAEENTSPDVSPLVGASLREQVTRAKLDPNRPSGNISEIPAISLSGDGQATAAEKQTELEKGLLPEALSPEAQKERAKKVSG